MHEPINHCRLKHVVFFLAHFLGDAPAKGLGVGFRLVLFQRTARSRTRGLLGAKCILSGSTNPSEMLVDRSQLGKKLLGDIGGLGWLVHQKHAARAIRRSRMSRRALSILSVRGDEMSDSLRSTGRLRISTGSRRVVSGLSMNTGPEGDVARTSIKRDDSANSSISLVPISSAIRLDSSSVKVGGAPAISASTSASPPRRSPTSESGVGLRPGRKNPITKFRVSSAVALRSSLSRYGTASCASEAVALCDSIQSARWTEKGGTRAAVSRLFDERGIPALAADTSKAPMKQTVGSALRCVALYWRQA